MRAMDACLTFLGEELEKKEAEEGKAEQIVNAWIVVSINKMGKEQERVLVLTDNVSSSFNLLSCYARD